MNYLSLPENVFTVSSIHGKQNITRQIYSLFSKLGTNPEGHLFGVGLLGDHQNYYLKHFYS